jgi:hypothetical protein
LGNSDGTKHIAYFGAIKAKRTKIIADSETAKGGVHQNDSLMKSIFLKDAYAYVISLMWVRWTRYWSGG